MAHKIPETTDFSACMKKKEKKEKKEERKRRKGKTRPTVPLIFYVQPFLSVAPEINFVTGLLNVWV